MLYLSALETLRVEAPYKSTAFTFTFTTLKHLVNWVTRSYTYMTHYTGYTTLYPTMAAHWTKKHQASALVCL